MNWAQANKLTSLDRVAIKQESYIDGVGAIPSGWVFGGLSFSWCQGYEAEWDERPGLDPDAHHKYISAFPLPLADQPPEVREEFEKDPGYYACMDDYLGSEFQFLPWHLVRAV